MRHYLITTIMSAFIVLSANHALALTLKKGQVLGGDGVVYDGASPQQKAALVANSKRKDFFGNEQGKSGLTGSNLFIVVEDDVVFVPITEVVGKDKDAVKDIIMDAVETQFVLNYAVDQAAKENLTPEQTEVLIAVLQDDFDPEEMDASLAEITSALDSLDIDATARAATEAAWEGISVADLEEATAYAAERIAADNAIQSAIDEAAASGEEVDWEALQQQYPGSVEMDAPCYDNC